MTEPTITCPSCRVEIKLTESLAAPLLEATRREYERRLLQKEQDMATRESALRAREEAVIQAKAGLEEQVAEQVRQERVRIAAEEASKAKLALAADLEDKTRTVADLQRILEEQNLKLAEAQKAQAEVLRRQRALDDAQRELDLTVERRLQEGLTALREQARRELEEPLKLKVLERDQTIAAMQKQVEELKRKAEQGSQQLQGEVLELQLEAVLGGRFPQDTMEPVPKGEHGGDLLQRIIGGGRNCGTILWETKRTKNWVDGWLPKLREDQRTARAEVAVLVSQVLPKGVETFDLIEGVWVTHPRAVVPVALALRQMLIDVACARSTSEGRQTKMELVYHYLTGPRFHQRVEAIVEAFTSMKDDLDKEKRVLIKQWAKREEQIDRVMQATVGMYGDLQGIAGKSLREIEGLELPSLEGPPLFPDLRDEDET